MMTGQIARAPLRRVAGRLAAAGVGMWEAVAPPAAQQLPTNLTKEDLAKDNRVMEALVALIADIRTAAEKGATAGQLQKARQLQRQGQFLLDFIEAENSMGTRFRKRCAFWREPSISSGRDRSPCGMGRKCHDEVRGPADAASTSHSGPFRSLTLPHQEVSSPRRNAAAMASARLSAPSRAKSVASWVSTSPSLTPRRPAISLVARPLASS
jgi:Cytochrome c552